MTDQSLHPVSESTGASASSASSVPPHIGVHSEVTQVRRRWLIWTMGGTLLLCLFGIISLWQRLDKIQGQLARQTQEANQASQEARLLARGATDASVQSTAKLAVLEAKTNELAQPRIEIATQRNQPKVWSQRAQQHDPPQTGGPYHGALR